MASTTNFTISTQKSFGPGLVTTPSVTLPNQQFESTFFVDLVMNAADIADPSLTIGYAIQIQDPITLLWADFMVGTWTGGPTQTALSFFYSCTVFPSTKVRATVNLSRAVSIGVNGRYVTLN